MITRPEPRTRTEAALGRCTQIVSEEAARQGLAGLSAAIAVGGEVRWSGGAGCSDGNSNHCAGHTAYRIASVSKALTAVAVGKLVEEGRLDLDDEIQRAVPGFPLKTWPLTLRHLLSHTGGVRHHRNDAERLNRRAYARLEEALPNFCGDQLLFEPGTACSYSTLGYTLLGCAVEGASGQPFTEYLKANIAQPSGMRMLGAAHLEEGQGSLAKRFSRAPSGALNPAAELDTSDRVPGGGLYSTAEDLVRFGAALLDGSLLATEMRERLFEVQRLRDGRAAGEVIHGRFLEYGLGWMRHRDPAGRRIVGHGGGQAGARGLLCLLPDEQLVVAVLSNTNPECDPYAVAYALIEEAAQAFCSTLSAPPKS